MGLFTDAYDLFCIPPIMQLIGRVYFENEPEYKEYQLRPVVLSTLLGIVLLATVIGQLVFGWFGDRIGRRKYYPLSATIMSEFANKRTRGAFIAAVFSMQGFGILASSTVTMVVCAIFDHASHNVSKDLTPKAVDTAWRLILMLGAVPAGLTWYWRMTMPETARIRTNHGLVTKLSRVAEGSQSFLGSGRSSSLSGRSSFLT
uniref:Major facilitator superfamily (MFS) profile domain-containing protein n=1 Tax=Fagus sylvatica TaxID=28930 RepID=A0A2N9GMA3_FAGSY